MEAEKNIENGNIQKVNEKNIIKGKDGLINFYKDYKKKNPKIGSKKINHLVVLQKTENEEKSIKKENQEINDKKEEVKEKEKEEIYDDVIIKSDPIEEENNIKTKYIYNMITK